MNIEYVKNEQKIIQEIKTIYKTINNESYIKELDLAYKLNKNTYLK